MSLADDLVEELKDSMATLLRDVANERLPIVHQATQDIANYTVAMLSTTNDGDRNQFETNIKHCVSIIASETSIVKVKVLQQYQTGVNRVIKSVIDSAFKAMIASL